MAFLLPQFGIFAQGTHAHHFLEFDLRPDVTPTRGRRLVPEAADIRGLGRRREPGRRVRRGRLARSRPGGLAGVARSVPRHHGTRRSRRSGDPARRLDLDQQLLAGRGLRPRARRHERRRRCGAPGRGAAGVLVPRGPGRDGIHRRDREPAGPPSRGGGAGTAGRARPGGKPCPRDAMGARPGRVPFAPRQRARGRDRANQGRQHRARRRRQAAHRTHRARRAQGRRP